MSAFKDSGHLWWQQCQQCRQAWFVGDKPSDVDEDVTCPRCDAEDLRVIAAREEGRREGFEKAEGIAEACRKEREALRRGLEETEGQRAGERLTWLSCKESEAERIRDAIRAMRDGAGERQDAVRGCAEVCDFEPCRKAERCDG